MTNKYELTTIKDIFDKVPTDRIPLCCRELGTVLAAWKALDSISPMVCEKIVWIDDDQNEVTMHLQTSDGTNIGALQMTLQSEVQNAD